MEVVGDTSARKRNAAPQCLAIYLFIYLLDELFNAEAPFPWCLFQKEAEDVEVILSVPKELQ